MDAKTLKKALRKLGACAEAREWAGGRTLAQAWAECPRGDWLLWLAARAGVGRKTVVLAACAVARTALKYVPAGEKRPLKAIETTEAWARAEPGVTLEDVRKARMDASAADAYAYADAAVAAAAAADADAADAADARQKALMQSADTVREMLPLEVVEAALKAKEES